MSTNQLNSLVTFSLAAWLNVTIFYNSTEAQCRWLKEGLFGKSLVFLLKLCSINHPPLYQERAYISPRSAARFSFVWGSALLASVDFHTGMHQPLLTDSEMQFTSLYYRRKATPGCRSYSLSIFDKNFYFCTAVVVRHTLLVKRLKIISYFPHCLFGGLWKKHLELKQTLILFLSYFSGQLSQKKK